MQTFFCRNSIKLNLQVEKLHKNKFLQIAKFHKIKISQTSAKLNFYISQIPHSSLTHQQSIFCPLRVFSSFPIHFQSFFRCRFNTRLHDVLKQNDPLLQPRLEIDALFMSVRLVLFKNFVNIYLICLRNFSG